FVCGMKSRRSDGFLAVYLSYDAEKWLENWIHPDSELAKLIRIGHSKRCKLGIPKVEISDNQPAAGSSSSIFDRGKPVPAHIHIVSGGLVRPK
ncbi:MAG TPA: hypothetical protein VLA21_06495, partial [Candidatus Limnocylindria bacterium]|nr:hypothetical protein [Candidatus Limnocylindria bacterium]